MKFTKKTEYGLKSLIQLARLYGTKRTVSLKEIAAGERYPLAFIEKIFQKLRGASIVVSHYGKQGGYSLARDPSEITLKEIIEAVEGATFEAFCDNEVRETIVCNHLCLCELKPVWKKTRQLLDEYYASISLEHLAAGRTYIGAKVAA